MPSLSALVPLLQNLPLLLRGLLNQRLRRYDRAQILFYTILSLYLFASLRKFRHLCLEHSTSSTRGSRTLLGLVNLSKKIGLAFAKEWLWFVRDKVAAEKEAIRKQLGKEFSEGLAVNVVSRTRLPERGMAEEEVRTALALRAGADAEKWGNGKVGRNGNGGAAVFFARKYSAGKYSAGNTRHCQWSIMLSMDTDSFCSPELWSICAKKF